MTLMRCLPGFRGFGASLLALTALALEAAGEDRAPSQVVGPDNHIESACLNRKGDRVLVGDRVAGVSLWDAAGGKAIRTYKSEAGPVQSVAFSNDGESVLAIAKGPRLPEEEIKPYSNLSRVSRWDGVQIIVWNAGTGQLLGRMPDRKHTLIAASMDGRSGDVSVLLIDGRYLRWHVGDKPTIPEGTGRRYPSIGMAYTHASFDRTARRVAARSDTPDLAPGVSGSSLILVRDMATGAARDLASPAGSVGAVGLSPDGTRVAFNGHKSELIVLDAESGKLLVRADMPPGNEYGYVGYSPDATLVATGSNSGQVRFFDANTLKELGATLGPEGEIRDAVFIEGRLRLLCGGHRGSFPGEPIPGPPPIVPLRVWDAPLPKLGQR